MTNEPSDEVAEEANARAFAAAQMEYSGQMAEGFHNVLRSFADKNVTVKAGLAALMQVAFDLAVATDNPLELIKAIDVLNHSHERMVCELLHALDAIELRRRSAN